MAGCSAVALVAGVGPALGAGAVLLWHWLQTGNPLVSPAGSPLTGTAEGYGFSLDLFLPNLWNMLLALQWGLLPFCPALAPAAWGWWLLLRQRGQAAFAALAALWMAVPYCLVMAIYDGVRDGVNYGPRYLTPLLPLLLFGVIGFLQHARLRAAGTRLMWLLVALSLGINLPAAIGSWLFGTRHPLEALL